MANMANRKCTPVGVRPGRKAFRFEWVSRYDDNWGFDIIMAPNYTAAKNFILREYETDDTKVTYIAEMKWERPDEEDE